MPHVLVSPGDVTHLACDAWLLPTDRALSIREHWYDSVPELPTRDALLDHATDLMAGRSHASVLPSWDGPVPGVIPGSQVLPGRLVDDEKPGRGGRA